MSLDTIMNMSITVESRAPSQAGFGMPLLFGYHTHNLGQLVKQYAQADEMLDDGFTTDDALYKAAQIVKSQDPCPDAFKIGRRVVALTQIVILTPQITTPGYKYKGTIGGKVVSYTNGASETLTTIGTALAALITALTVDVTAASVVGVVTCTCGTPGKVVDYDWAPTTPPKKLGMKDATVDTTTDDELPIVNIEDSDWYGLMIIDSSSKATALNGAGWIETKRKLFVAQTSDTEVLDSVVLDDTISLLKDSSYARTGAIWHRGIGGSQWLAQGWLAGALTTTPGAATMAYKSVAGVKLDKLESGEEAAILAKNGSHYTDVGLPVTFEGKTGSGAFMDTARFIDWVYARMRESVLLVLANNPKIPFTDNGVDIMRLAIMNVIQLGQAAGGFAKDPPPTVTAPLVKNVSTANRIARTLPDLQWTAQLAGAIHRLVPVRGRVSV